MSRPDRESPTAVAFSPADHFPLGRAFGATSRVVESPSAARPFGLTLARPPRVVHVVDRTTFRYDDDLQIGTVRCGVDVVPLSKHTDGTTNTVTDGGDGQTSNKDSDTDERED